MRLTKDIRTSLPRLRRGAGRKGDAVSRSIAEWQRYIYDWAKRLGWWDPPEEKERTIPELIALAHSELSEALEIVRDGHAPSSTWFDDSMKPAGLGIEFADCVIRILDTCERYGIDLEKCIETKMAYNETRTYRHGGKTL